MNDNTDQRLVLLLHGNSGSSADMRGLEKLFALKEHQVLNIDLPLHGANLKFSRSLTIFSCAEYFRDVLSNYPNRDITIVGYSDGANIALRLIQMEIQNITNAVLISPNSDAREVVPIWRFVFLVSRIAMGSVLYIPLFRRIFRRIGMMTNFHLDLLFPRIPKQVILMYAEKDMIRKIDQERIGRSLGVEVKVVRDTSHFSIVGSEYVRQLVWEKIV